MALVNIHFLNLQNNYLFADIAKKVNAFKVMHPGADVISLGIGDVTQPLCPAVTEAMHKAVDEMASAEGFPSDDASKAALVPVYVGIEMPASEHSSEISTVLNEEHTLIMTRENTIEEGIEAMGPAELRDSCRLICMTIAS